MIRRATVLVALIVAAWSWPLAVASAHTGAGRSTTSDFRTRITAVAPAVPGLEVRIADLDGRVEVSWTGAGELVVLGYEGEPYLRITAAGVERNARSPATYLNADRYARRPVPPDASATAAPEWEHLSAGHMASWHDHRTHYMSPGKPREAAGADHPVMLNPRWEVALVAGGPPVTVAGDLAWFPPPRTSAWLLVAGAGALAVLGLLLTRRWRRLAVMLGLGACVLLTVDSVGYLRAWPRSTRATIWLLAWPVLAAAAALLAVPVLARIRLGRRNVRAPELVWAALALGGLVLAAIGGYDRIDVIRHRFVDSDLPANFTRVAVVVCLGVGVGMLARVLVWLLPAALGPRPSPART